MADRLGQQFGNYRLEALLGTGGFAEVYLGQHVRLNQQAAIKVLHAHLTAREAEHFQQEAQTIATLVHPGIVRVFDYDVQEGVPFLVMDYAPNGSLRYRYPKGSQVPLPLLASYVKQVGAALQYAHDHKFIHRDVKPENMLLGRNGEVLLSDFGLAALAHSSTSLSTQEAIGTISYMAPEQLEGHPRAASDQYALAVVVYEWLCGQRPFEGSATEVLVQHLSMPPPPLHERLPTIPHDLEQVVLRALAKDPKARFASVAAFAEALERASQGASVPPNLLSREAHTPSSAGATGYDTVAQVSSPPGAATEATPFAERPVGTWEPTVFPDSSAPNDLDTPEGGTGLERPQQDPLVAPMAAVVSPPLEPTMPFRRKARRLPRVSAALLVGLMVVVIAGGVLGSFSLLAHLGVLGTGSGPTTLTAVRGGTWIYDYHLDPGSFIPNASNSDVWIDQALYLPLFYGDAQGVIRAGAASAVPTVQNGGISTDVKTWTFHLRSGLVWSDGQPYDARDVDFTWRLWANPKFPANTTTGLNLISSADVSADHLSITFHLTRPFAPFLADLWTDGVLAPLPAHHFSRVAPQAISKSPDNLNPTVTSGPFMMGQSVPGDHFTLVRNPHYYRASEGLPYLGKIIFRIGAWDAILKDMQAGSIDSTWLGDLSKAQAFQPLYTPVSAPTSATFEAMFFNFHNQILASHPEVRQAMAMAIDQQILITQARHGFATPLCTDHGSAYHPGYDPSVSVGGYYCPVVFDPALATQLLSDHGWVKGADGVRTKGGQRLEFEYSTTVGVPSRSAGEAILERDFMEIGIKLDIQNYAGDTFFGSFLLGGKASPPTGAVAGRFDIAEFADDFGYDPDDSSLLSCNQNLDFYCNPALDALYKQEQGTTDQGVRQNIFEQIHQIYLTQFPFITLWGQLDTYLVRKGTHNFLPNPFGVGTNNIWEWWCDNGKC